jgi:DNA primase
VTLATPEAKAALWRRLAGLAGSIRDEETRAQYLADWRGRFDAAFPPPPPGLTEEAMLPDGSDVPRLSDQKPRVQAALKRVHAQWLERELARTDSRTPAQLNGFAYSLGRRVGIGTVEEIGAVAALNTAQASTPEAVEADVGEAYRAGTKRPFDLGPELLDLACAQLQRTDMGNAERFHARFGKDFLYTTEKGWLGYDGRRYRVLTQEKDVTPSEVLGAVFATVRAIQDEARFIAATGFEIDDLVISEAKVETEFGQRKLSELAAIGGALRAQGAHDKVLTKGSRQELLSVSIGKWGRASEASGRLGCIANLAKRWLTVKITDFDQDPMLLNCLNGTLRFLRADDDGPARVELKPHDRGDLLTKLTACDYDPDAPAAEWQKLVRWAQPKPERRRYLRQWLGYNLTGDMGEQIFHIWWGPTAANGKSTVGNAAREAIGDYGDITNVETFLDEGMKKRGDQATPDIVRLPGVRFLTSGEPGPGSKFNEPLINSVTGGDPMLARDNFRSFFRFSPAFKWTVWCNKKPDIPQGTEGIWRRVKVLLWESHLEADQRDRTLPDRLKAEHAGILAWMVRGLIDWMEHGFVEPEDVTLQSEAYRDDSDPLASFLRMCTVEEPGSRVQSSHLYELFCAWAKAAGEAEWKQKGFSRAMKDRGFDNKQSNGMQWLGLRMVKAVHDFIDSEGRVVTIRVDDWPRAAPPAPASPPPQQRASRTLDDDD